MPELYCIVEFVCCCSSLCMRLCSSACTPSSLVEACSHDLWDSGWTGGRKSEKQLTAQSQIDGSSWSTHIADNPKGGSGSHEACGGPCSMAEATFDAGTRERVQKLPLLSTNAGPRDKEAWEARLKEVRRAFPSMGQHSSALHCQVEPCDALQCAALS